MTRASDKMYRLVFFSFFRLPSSKPIINVMETQETTRVSPSSPTLSSASSISSRSSESELMAGPSSPNSARLYLPKPRIPVQRRATITGASPVSKHAPLSLEQVMQIVAAFNWTRLSKMTIITLEPTKANRLKKYLTVVVFTKFNSRND